MVAGYGGSSEALFRTQILAPFARAHGVQITYVAGTSATNLARLQAERDKPQIDLAVLDDGPMQQAVSLGLCQPLASAPVYRDLYAIAMANGEGRAVGIGIVATGLAYNTQVFARNGWPAPTSWTDLGDPRFRGRVLVPSISNTYGLQTLLALARQGGGDAHHVEPGFAFMAQRVAPDVLSFETSSGTISELFQTGAVVLGVWGNGRSQALAKTGFPIAFVTPKEGAQALLTMACVVNGSHQAALAQALMQDLLSPRVQTLLATQGWVGAHQYHRHARSRSRPSRGLRRTGRDQARVRRLEDRQRFARGMDRTLDARNRALIPPTLGLTWSSVPRLGRYAAFFTQ
ncbi:ABC transporter substrate-binding protein [Burkholderia pseudomallei]|uniref:ABC transporter substrate-binding protein n=1 Tax=Burkholderia pseudomallei TaxID=28450 RepID=UPI0024696F8D|nr:ABC transporter substrate-binding protein [Burkholderia pseudomallei]